MNEEEEEPNEALGDVVRNREVQHLWSILLSKEANERATRVNKKT